MDLPRSDSVDARHEKPRNQKKQFDSLMWKKRQAVAKMKREYQEALRAEEAKTDIKGQISLGILSKARSVLAKKKLAAESNAKPNAMF